jgi:hypothetical protein
MQVGEALWQAATNPWGADYVAIEDALVRWAQSVDQWPVVLGARAAIANIDSAIGGRDKALFEQTMLPLGPINAVFHNRACPWAWRAAGRARQIV